MTSPARHGGLVWLASYPKSGNTWLRLFLHALIQSEKGQPDINAMGLLTTGDSSARWYDPFLQEPLGQVGMEAVAAARPHANRAIAQSTDGLVFVKTHNALVAHLGTPMIDMSVTAGAVYVTRNPLDVAISYARFMNVSIDHAITLMNTDGALVESKADHAYEYRGSWREHVGSWTRKPARQLHVMRYEDMLEKPFETFSRLAGFLRLSVSKAQIEAAIAATSFEKVQAQEENTGFRERPETMPRFFREGRAGQWREVLTGAQIDAILAANSEQMARFGYTERAT
ncbi:MAG TPA: sulfotransferase domain-containing protein [Novosphingobium sp.]|nr:sulfotransferase domain-containing protein [Novosphingobium sp.]